MAHRLRCDDAKRSPEATDKVHILELLFEEGVAGRPDVALTIPLRSGGGASLVGEKAGEGAVSWLFGSVNVIAGTLSAILAVHSLSSRSSIHMRRPMSALTNQFRCSFRMLGDIYILTSSGRSESELRLKFATQDPGCECDER